MASIPSSRLKPLADLPAGHLLVHEIYASIQGESSYAGLPCVFVRTAACNLRCTYCDTAHAFTQGDVMSIDAVFDRVRELRLPLVEVTGGEPLLQPAVHDLMKRLCDAGHTVLLETGGSLDIRPVDPRVIKIVDIKTPSSGEQDANLLRNLDALAPTDEVKLVVGDRPDYEWARALIRRHDLPSRCSVLIGPIHGAIEPRCLAEWILEDRLDVRMQIQLHKAIWDPDTKSV